jgi:plasmid stabilization system protein ParE
MKYRVVIEPSARIAIRRAARWIEENRSPEIAIRWTRGLERAIATLESMPTRCPVAAENDEFPYEIRELLYGRRPNVYRIVFTVRGDSVSVLFVHHAARDELRP